MMPEQQSAEGDLPDWQKAAVHRFIERSSEGSKIGTSLSNLIVGGIAIVMGIPRLAENSLNVSPVLFGGCLVLTGLAALFVTRRWVMLLDAFFLTAIGCWNTFLATEGLSFTALSSEFSPIQAQCASLAAFQFYLGWKALKPYLAWRRFDRQKPEAEAFRELDEQVSGIVAAQASEHDDMIEFTTRTLVGTQSWKGRLFPDGALIVKNRGEDFVFCTRDMVQFEDRGKGVFGRARPTTFVMAGNYHKGTITQEYLARFNTWRNSPSVLADA